MKRISKKHKKPSLQERRVVFSPVHYSTVSFLIILVTLLLASIGLRVYKAVHTGIIYDEVYTVWNFGQHFHDALTSYKNPNNNHIINSILINVCRILFPTQEYFYRFHTILFGALYCVSVFYLVQALITSRLLRVGFVALLTLQWFVFDLSFLARGYSIALAAIFGGLAMLVFLLKRKISFSYIWLPVSILIGMNFLAFGSMLSVLLMLFVINSCYIFFFSFRAFRNEMKPFKPMIIHLFTVPVCSGLFSYWLYQFIYKDILAARSNFGATPLANHLRDVLWVNIIATDQRWAQGVYLVFLLLTGAAVLYLIYIVLKTRSPERISFLNLRNPQTFIVLTTVLFFAGMVVYRNVFKLSLGYPRNGVFLIPLFLLSCGIVLDSACTLLGGVRLRRVFIGIVCLVTIATTMAARPSLYAVKVSTWEIQSIAGPLIHDLQTIDPHRHWKIALTKQTWHMNLPLQYYRLKGYPVQQAAGNDFDVVVAHSSENIAGASLYRQDFYDSFECKIVFNPVLIQQYSLNEKARQ